MELIDRGYALAMACSGLVCRLEDGDFKRVEDVRRDLKEVPTVDAIPVRHGRWIGYPECLKYENALDDSDIVCSVCGEVFDILDNDTERFDYCPHCGADMRGGETE